MLHPPRTLRFWHRNKPAKKFPALHGQKNPHLPQGRPEVSLLRCKADITRLQKNNLFIFRVRLQILVNLFRAVFCKHWLLIFFYCFCHASRTDQHIRLLTRLRAPASSVLLHQSDSGDHDVPFHGQIKFFNEIPLDLVLRESFFLFRRPIRTTRTPAFLAASIFLQSRHFFRIPSVTIHSAWNDCSIATFMSIENGPCMPMVCAASNQVPRRMQLHWQRQHPGIHTVL